MRAGKTAPQQGSGGDAGSSSAFALPDVAEVEKVTVMPRLLSRILWVAIAIGIVELGSCGLLARAPALGARMQLAAAGVDPGARGQAQARIDDRAHEGVTRESIHPYLGFAVTPSNVALAGPPSLDALGFPNGGPLVRDASPDTVVIGIFGGSVAAYFASWGGAQAILDDLQQLPRFRGKTLVALTAAHLGWKQPQLLIALAYLQALGVHFDVAILLDGFNEVVAAPRELVPAGVSPFYPSHWHQHVANLDVATGMRERIGIVGLLKQRREQWAQRVLGSPLRHSRFVQLVWSLYDRALEVQLEAQRVALDTERATKGKDFAATGPPWRGDEDALVRELASLWFESSLEMRALAEARGTLFFHFLQPNQHVPGSKPIDADEAAVAIRGGEAFAPYAERGYRLLRERGAELRVRGVRYHDLTQIYANVQEPIYVDNIGHVGARGNGLMAAAMAKAIAADLSAER